ncbi:hypothetical protein KHU50_011598 [Colletotrichum sp. SAR 10_65]|nr:hypothetical protein KHU50_011598 [Colletotrichum sp. SAR 10_65]KAJ5004196.1 hypothetical protein K4K48_010366 [Colletotrichum sp. SAR 10_66]
MTHRIPFNNTMDENNVVELQDEWLYDMPAFFLPPTKIEANVNSKEQARTSVGSRESATAGDTNTTSRFQGIKMDFRNSKEKRSIQVISSKTITTTRKIDEIMAKGRSPESAKKRIWLFLSSHPSNNCVVLSTVSEREIAEKKALQEFYDRHEATNDFFREKTKAKYNTWETEVHLSYHDLVEKGQNSDTADNPVSMKVDEPTITFPPLKEGYGDVCLKKSVMSFRIEGDFFDRYWTCRILFADPKWRMPDPWSEDGKSLLENFDEEDGNYAENDNAEDELSDETSGDEDNVKRQALRYPFFEQRRILELNLEGLIHHGETRPQDLITKAL